MSTDGWILWVFIRMPQFEASDYHQGYIGQQTNELMVDDRFWWRFSGSLPKNLKLLSQWAMQSETPALFCNNMHYNIIPLVLITTWFKFIPRQELFTFCYNLSWWVWSQLEWRLWTTCKQQNILLQYGSGIMAAHLI